MRGICRWEGLLALAVVLASVGCSDEDTSGAPGIRNETIERTTALLRELGHSVEAAVEMQSVQSLGDGMAPLAAMADEVAGTESDPAPLPLVHKQAEEEDALDVDPLIDEVAEVLEEYVMTDDNIEEEGEDWVVFLLRSDTVCPQARDDELADCDLIDWSCDQDYDPEQCRQWEAEERQWCAEDAEASYDECVELLDTIELRMKVSEQGEDIFAQLWVGPDKINPLDIQLTSSSLGFDFDLAAIKDAILHVNEQFPEEDAPVLPAQFEGVVGVSLTKNGEQDVTLALAIKQALAIEGSITTGGDESCVAAPDGTVSCETTETKTIDVALSSQAADPLLAVRLQGIDEVITASLDLKRTLLTIPFADVFSYADPVGDFIVDLAGVDAEVVLQEGLDALIINELGLGDGETSVRHDDTPLLSLSLNRDAGNAFDVITSLVEDWPIFEFDPSVLLELYVNFGHIDQFLAPEEEPAPSMLRDQTYTLSVQPASGLPALSPFEAPLESTNGDGIEVVSGTLSLSSTAAPDETVVVDESMCLFGTDVLQEGAHEVLGHFYAGVCE